MTCIVPTTTIRLKLYIRMYLSTYIYLHTYVEILIHPTGLTTTRSYPSFVRLPHTPPMIPRLDSTILQVGWNSLELWIYGIQTLNKNIPDYDINTS